ncbi:unnamed protein product [Leuciscus chuanchicus]
MNIILHLTALQLMVITSNVAIIKSQGNWYCSPLANITCANASSNVNCRGQNDSCKAYSCIPLSDSCSCMVGSYNCTSDCYYEERVPDICKYNTYPPSCLRASLYVLCCFYLISSLFFFCLPDLKTPDNIQGTLTADLVMNLVDLIANMTDQMSPEMAKDYLKIVDAVQIKVSDLASAENKDKDKIVSYGNSYLNAFENLVSALVKPTEKYDLQNISLTNTEVRVLAVGPNASVKGMPLIRTEKASMDIDLFEIAMKSTSRLAAVAFMSYSSLENLLKPEFFSTSNDTNKTMMSTVISATLHQTNTTLTKPVTFTIKHIKEFDPNGSLSCVYWNISEWIVDGCSVLETNSSYTVCSCVHLSTFALIMQTSRPSKSDSPLDLLNLVCVIVGLVFFSLALLTFVLCQWSPAVNNVARINICLSLLLAHLLFLLTQQFLSLIRPHQVLCAVISGVLHFLFLSGFVWMFIEAVLLFICVKNLSQISSKKREVLSSGFLCLIGYTVALVVVAVSVGLLPEGYGSEQCWIKIDKGFIWSFLGPVCVILALNMILFINIIISLNSTLKNLNAEVSQMKQTKIMAFKTLAQFVILGCSWILGFFTNGRKELEILFLILNSQQGTFIFLVYCVLNNERLRIMELSSPCGEVPWSFVVACRHVLALLLVVFEESSTPPHRAPETAEASSWSLDVELEGMEYEETGLALSLPPSPEHTRGVLPVEFSHDYLCPSPEAGQKVWPTAAYTELIDVLSRATEKLAIDWPDEPRESQSSKHDETFLSGPNSRPERRKLPFFSDLHNEISRSWKQPFSALLTNASLAPSWKSRPLLPSKPCRTTSALIGKSYMAAGQAGMALHTMTIIQAYQVDVLKEMEEGTGLTPEAVKELCKATDLALRATKHTAHATPPNPSPSQPREPPFHRKEFTTRRSDPAHPPPATVWGARGRPFSSSDLIGVLS